MDIYLEKSWILIDTLVDIYFNIARMTSNRDLEDLRIIVSKKGFEELLDLCNLLNEMCVKRITFPIEKMKNILIKIQECYQKGYGCKENQDMAKTFNDHVESINTRARREDDKNTLISSVKRASDSPESKLPFPRLFVTSLPKTTPSSTSSSSSSLLTRDSKVEAIGNALPVASERQVPADVRPQQLAGNTALRIILTSV